MFLFNASSNEYDGLLDTLKFVVYATCYTHNLLRRPCHDLHVTMPVTLLLLN